MYDVVPGPLFSNDSISCNLCRIEQGRPLMPVGKLSVRIFRVTYFSGGGFSGESHMYSESKAAENCRVGNEKYVQQNKCFE